MAAENEKGPLMRVYRVQLNEQKSGFNKEVAYQGGPDQPLQGPMDGVLDQPLASFKKEMLDSIKNSGMEAAIRHQKNPVLLVGGLMQSAEMHFVADAVLPGSSNELFFAVVAGGVGSKALGGFRGAASEQTAVALVPLSRMELGAFEQQVGGGGYPPAERSMRDFSGKMNFIKNGIGEDGPASVVNWMGEAGIISGGVNTQGRLSYLVIKQKGEAAAHGDEMFSSMVKHFGDNGIEIHEVKDVWLSQSGMDTNWRQFMDAVHAGAVPEDAAMQTFTGRQARNQGMTRAEVVAGGGVGNDSPVEVIFRKPDWGDNQAWNDFANNWVSSMGRDMSGPSLQKPASGLTKEGRELTREVGESAGRKVREEALSPQSQLETDPGNAGNPWSAGAQAARAAMLSHLDGSGMDAREKSIVLAQVDKNLEQSAGRGEKISVQINVAEKTVDATGSAEIG